MDLAVVALRAKVDPDRLREWEEGVSHPTIAQLRNLATIYRRPLAVFYLPEPPRDFAPLHDLRRLPSTDRGRFSTALLFLIRHVREQEAWIMDTMQEAGAKPLGFVGSIRISDNTIASARRARELLRLVPGAQRSWGLRDWIDAVEDAGVFVFQSGDVPVQEMRGLVLTNHTAPIIVLNSKDAPRARIFTLFHEFAHILLGEESISNYIPGLVRQARTSEEGIEIRCNLLAAEMLVPEDDLRRRLESPEREEDLDALIESLARVYGVSREVVARRLAHVEFITKRTYGQKRRQYQLEFEEAEQEEQPRQIRILWATRVLSRNGRAFTRLVLSTYGEGTITGPDVSSLLGTKLNYLPAIEARAFAG